MDVSICRQQMAWVRQPRPAQGRTSLCSLYNWPSPLVLLIRYVDSWPKYEETALRNIVLRKRFCRRGSSLWGFCAKMFLYQAFSWRCFVWGVFRRGCRKGFCHSRGLVVGWGLLGNHIWWLVSRGLAAIQIERPSTCNCDKKQKLFVTCYTYVHPTPFYGYARTQTARCHRHHHQQQQQQPQRRIG